MKAVVFVSWASISRRTQLLPCQHPSANEAVSGALSKPASQLLVECMANFHCDRCSRNCWFL